MIESVSQIDSKITACCLFMEPLENWLVPSMLVAGANKERAFVTVYVKMICASPTVFLFHQLFYSAFLFYYHHHCHYCQRLALIN